jgi:hypothetical protein
MSVHKDKNYMTGSITDKQTTDAKKFRRWKEDI